jgi:hypothetical protein
MVDVETLGVFFIIFYLFFLTCHCDLSVSLIKLFSGIKKTSSLVTQHPDYLDF